MAGFDRFLASVWFGLTSTRRRALAHPQRLGGRHCVLHRLVQDAVVPHQHSLAVSLIFGHAMDRLWRFDRWLAGQSRCWCSAIPPIPRGC